MKSLNEKINQIIIESNEDVSLLFTNLKGDIFCECKKDEQVVSASTIKTPIMLAVLEEVRKGNVKLDDMIYVDEHVLLDDSKVFEDGPRLASLYELLVWMIILSDNTSTNVIINYFGMDRINRYIQNVLELKSTSVQRIMLDFKAIEEGKNNYISMNDMLVMYQKLMNHEILNDELCEVALEILCRQRWQDDIMRYIYEPVTFAHKTGSLDYRNLDVGVMMVNNEKYFIGISVKSVNIDGNQQLIGKLGRMIYDAIIQGDLC